MAGRNYWAIWCGPCREEPGAQRAASGFRTVFAVNFDGQEGETLAHRAELGIAFELLEQDPPRSRYSTTAGTSYNA